MPELEAEYQKFLESVEEETADPQWAIDNHPANKILDRFTPEFGIWVDGLQRSLLMKDGGYPFDKNDFSAIEWQALAILKQWQENKRNV